MGSGPGSDPIMKKHVICVFTSLLAFLFLANKSFSESTPSSIILGIEQGYDLQSPVIIPFANTGQIISEMKEHECDKGIVYVFNSNKRLEIQPTLNNLGIGQEVIIDPQTMSLAAEFDLITRNPLTMEKIDPLMDMFGIFFDFNPSESGVTENATFTAVFNIKPNCFSPTVGMSMSGMIDSSLPPVFIPASATSSGLIRNETAYSVRLDSARSSEIFAKNVTELEDITADIKIPIFMLTTAVDYLTLSLLELEDIKSMLEGSTIMVDMTTVQAKLQECIDKDNEAIMIFEEIKGVTPSLTDSAFTSAVIEARRLISEAIRCKKMVIGKLQRVEPRVVTE